MKKILLLCIVFSFMRLEAQEKFQPKNFVGINLGASASKMNFNPVVEQDINIGYGGGFIFKHFSEKTLGLQVELNFTQKGWAEKLEANNIYSRRLNYIELPCMTHVEVGKSNKRLFLNVGPCFSLMFSDKEKISLEDEKGLEKHYQVKIDNKLEFGAAFGIGLTRSTSYGELQFEIRGNQGITGIFGNKSNNLFSFSQNQQVGVKIAYFYNLGKIIKS